MASHEYDIAIITAIYDGYDTLKPAINQSGCNVNWVCVTDDANLIDNNAGWSIVHNPKPGMHPNRAAKFPKMLPWDYTASCKSVWIDASFRVVSERFAADMIGILDGFDISQFAHPWRDCVYQEAAETLRLPRYSDVHNIIPAQMERYRHEVSHPDNWGLWATGVIARVHNTEIKHFGKLWLDENLEHSYQDQLSEAPMLNMAGKRPEPLPGTHFANKWLSYEASGRHA